MKKNAYIGIDIGSISTKAVIIDDENNIINSSYIWTEANPILAVKNILSLLEKGFDNQKYEIVGSGTTGSARMLIGKMIGANIVKNEITAHTIGTLSFYSDVKTILEIGGQDSKIIILENQVAIDYAMNTLCAAGTGAFLSSQAKRLGIHIEDFGELALKSNKPVSLAGRCTVFAESDLVHKAQMGCEKEDLVAGLCNSIVYNYLNNVGKGKNILEPIIFQGGVSKNIGVVKAFEKILGKKVFTNENGHIMGAIGIAILAKKSDLRKEFSFKIKDIEFKTHLIECGKCANDCEIICLTKDGEFVDTIGNKCDVGHGVAKFTF